MSTVNERNAAAAMRRDWLWFGLIIGASLFVALGVLAFRPRAPIVPTPVPVPTATGGVPDGAAVLLRANEAADLARASAEQTANSIELVTNVTTILGTVLGALIIAATAIAGFFGLSNQREIREDRERLRQEERQVAALREQLQQDRLGFEQTRQEFQTFKAAVAADFKKTRQALALLEQGNRLFDEGKRGQAIEIYEEAQRLEPEHAEIAYRLGRAYSNAGRTQAAITAFERALALLPESAESHMELGLAYRRHGDTLPDAAERRVFYQQAERSLLQATARRPDYADALSTLGGIYRRLGRYPDALTYYLRAGDADPHWSYAPNNIASLYWRLGNVELARQYFERVEALASRRIGQRDEHTHWALYDRALARLALGRLAEALEDHQAAIALTPAPDNFCSVLDNLRMLQAGPPMDGLDGFIALIEARKPDCPQLAVTPAG